jgi:transposase-like protein
VSNGLLVRRQAVNRHGSGDSRHRGKALEQLKSGKSLFGKDGAFAPLLKNFIEKALDAEMDGHLDEDQRDQGNKRNGRGKKTIKSSSGSFEIEKPRTVTAALNRN